MRVRTMLAGVLTAAALLAGVTAPGSPAHADDDVTTVPVKGRGPAVTIDDIQDAIANSLGGPVGDPATVFVLETDGTFQTAEKIRRLPLFLPRGGQGFDVRVTIKRRPSKRKMADLPEETGPITPEQIVMIAFDWGALYVEATPSYTV